MSSGTTPTDLPRRKLATDEEIESRGAIASSLWSLVTGIGFFLAFFLLIFGTVAAVTLGVVWGATLAERHLGLPTLPTVVAFIGVVLVTAVWHGVNRLHEALVLHRYRYFLEDDFEEHTEETDEDSETIEAVEALRELQHNRQARRAKRRRGAR